jgi:hypothetical protein
MHQLTYHQINDSYFLVLCCAYCSPCTHYHSFTPPGAATANRLCTGRSTVAHAFAPFHSIRIKKYIFCLLDHSAILRHRASQVLFAYLSTHLLHFEALLDSRALSNGLHKALPSANAASSVVSAATAAADASANAYSVETSYYMLLLS